MFVISMDEDQAIQKRPGIGTAIMLFYCYVILALCLLRQSPAVPFSGFMPEDLWVVSGDEIPAARAWVYSIFSAYIALGVIGWVCCSRLVCFAVPTAIVAGSLLALLRWAAAMASFN
jgi:hypothetical protein